MEFCDAGSLDEAIQHGKFHGGVTEGLRHMRVILRAVCLTLLDIASAMTHLHSMRIVHKDLKPKNVLLSSCPVHTTSHSCVVCSPALSVSWPGMCSMQDQTYASQCIAAALQQAVLCERRSVDGTYY